VPVPSERHEDVGANEKEDGFHGLEKRSKVWATEGTELGLRVHRENITLNQPLVFGGGSY
jgi:hypothetical protein